MALTTFSFSCRRTNPNTNSDIQPPPSRLGPRNVTARSTFHSGQTRPRTQNGPDRSIDPNSPGARQGFLTKLTSRFSKRLVNKDGPGESTTWSRLEIPCKKIANERSLLGMRIPLFPYKEKHNFGFFFLKQGL